MVQPVSFAHMDSLASVIDAGDRSVRRRLWAKMVITVLGDFGLVYWQIAALAQQRAGKSHDYETYMYGVAIALWFVVSQQVSNQVSRALAKGTQALTDGIVGRLRRLPLEKFETLGRGALIMRLIGDAQRVVNAAEPLVGVPTALIRLALGAVFAFVVSSSAAVIAAAAMWLMGLAIAAQLQAMHEGAGKMADDEERMYDLLRGHVSGVTQLKLHTPRARAIGQAFAAVSDRLRALRVSIFSAFFERQHMANALFYGILGLNVFVLPLVAPVANESIREINLVLVWVVFSVFGIVFQLPELTMAAEALKRLRELAAQLDEGGLEPAPDAAAVARGRFKNFEKLEVRGLQFHYEQSAEQGGFAVGPIDATFRRGEVVFITGNNGSGKSTFLKMLTGLYTSRTGELRVDDTVVNPSDLPHYRELFSTIFTDHHIFARTFGVAAEEDERARELLKEMEIADKTSVVGGRVKNRDLSTGQKKRLAMALARLQDRPILIFDEWAADQEPEFRALFYHQILPGLGATGKLVVAVTHDDQYFHCADRVLHFDAGRLRPSTPAGGP
jgi:putative ATP-binding cassette transporter